MYSESDTFLTILGNRSATGKLAPSSAVPIFQGSKVGCPIRKSTDQSLFAAPHGLSQRITSFIACACQGIHQMPLRHLIVLIANAHHCPPAHAGDPSGSPSAQGAVHQDRRPFGLANPKGFDRRHVLRRMNNSNKRETSIVASFSSEAPTTPARVQRGSASCDGASCQLHPLGTELTKDQLPETGPDDGGQAHQSLDPNGEPLGRVWRRMNSRRR